MMFNGAAAFWGFLGASCGFCAPPAACWDLRGFFAPPAAFWGFLGPVPLGRTFNALKTLLELNTDRVCYINRFQ